jgi:hypothetical protein
MAYMRGRHYLWRDDRLHVWVADGHDGHDGWDEPDWGEAHRTSGEGHTGSSRPSGVSLPQDVADEYVVMRLAELLRDGVVLDAIERALTNHAGNGGAVALVQYAEELRRAFRQAPEPLGEE